MTVIHVHLGTPAANQLGAPFGMRNRVEANGSAVNWQRGELAGARHRSPAARGGANSAGVGRAGVHQHSCPGRTNAVHSLPGQQPLQPRVGPPALHLPPRAVLMKHAASPHRHGGWGAAF